MHILVETGNLCIYVEHLSDLTLSSTLDAHPIRAVGNSDAGREASPPLSAVFNMRGHTTPSVGWVSRWVLAILGVRVMLTSYSFPIRSNGINEENLMLIATLVGSITIQSYTRTIANALTRTLRRLTNYPRALNDHEVLMAIDKQKSYPRIDPELLRFAFSCTWHVSELSI